MTTRVVTQNIDFYLSNFGWDKIVENLKPKADVILFQEAKNTNLHRYADKDWAVFQDSRHDGTGIMWRRAHARRFKNPKLQLQVDQHKGVQMEARYIASVDLEIDGRAIRFGSSHYPPQRFDFLWDEANDATAAWIRRARKDKIAFVLGGDYNAPVMRDSHDIRRRFGLLLRGVGIDGFVVSRGLKASKAQDLGDNRSDHNPVRIRVSFRKRLRDLTRSN